MKRMLIMLLAVAISVTAAVAQDGNGAPRDPAKMREMMKERLKAELKLTDAQADSVASIQQEFGGKSRELRSNTTLSDEDKKAKMEELNQARKKRMKTVLTDEQVQKLEELNEKARKERMQRQGQGNN
jgi:periplasmic protein CpxP/Spy